MTARESWANVRRGRVRPHNLEAEESLLGAMLLSSDATAACSALCSAADFYKPSHGSIFAAVVALFERGEPVDAVTVTDELRRSSVLDSIGDPAVLVSLQANTPSIANAIHYARQVVEYAWLRRAQADGESVADAAEAIDVERVNELRAAMLLDSGPNVASSWSPVDLTAVQDDAVEPALLRRTDGAALLYPGAVTSLSGEPEAGKSHVGQRAVCDEVKAGRQVVVVDFETSPGAYRDRLRAHGLTVDELRQVYYVRPDSPPTAADRRRLVDVQPTVAVVDGVAEALALDDLDEDKAGVVTWYRDVPRLLADAGAAVLVLDHPVKANGAPTRYARGSSAKLATVDVALRLDAVETFGRGRSGSGRLLLAKDRPGHLRGLTADGILADVAFLAGSGGSITVELRPPSGKAERQPTAKLRPTARRVLAALRCQPEGVALTARSVGDALAEEGPPVTLRAVQIGLASLRTAGLAADADGRWSLNRSHDDSEGVQDAS